MESFSTKLVVKDPQPRCLSNPEMTTKQHARSERLFFKHQTNCSSKIIRQGPAEPGIVK
jgi:hypothetical protein